jgi:hypothetical protein
MMFGVHEENLAFGGSRIVNEWIQELYCPGILRSFKNQCSGPGPFFSRVLCMIRLFLSCVRIIAF